MNSSNVTRRIRNIERIFENSKHTCYATLAYAKFMSDVGSTDLNHWRERFSNF